MEYTNGKEHKGMETSLLFPNGTHEGLGNPILTCYICKARAIVKEVEPFERIAYLTVEQSLKLKASKEVKKGERERGDGGVRESLYN